MKKFFPSWVFEAIFFGVSLSLLGCLIGFMGFIAINEIAPRPLQAQPYAGTIYCNQSKVYDTNNNGSTRLVQGSVAGQQLGSIYICGYIFSSITSVNVKLVAGTQVTTACDTNTVSLTPAWQFQATTVGIASIADFASNDRGLVVPAGNDLCINTSAGNSVQATVYFYQQR